MKHLPSIKQMQYLTALAETNHFSKAAQLCNVTQSTLSAGVKELEVILGAKLAERTKRSVIMTPIGKETAERAKKLICDAEDMVALAAAKDGPLTGYLQLGIIPTVAPYLLPKIFPVLRTQYPSLELGLREAQTAVLVEEVLSGKIDLALLALPASDRKLAEKSLFNDPFVLVVPSNHALADKGEVDARMLNEEKLLLLEEGHCFRDQAIEFCNANGLSHFKTLGTTSLATISQMVPAGFGLTLLPQMAVEKEAANNKDLAVCMLKSPQPFRTIGLIWRNNSPRTAEFEALGELVLASSVS